VKLASIALFGFAALAKVAGGAVFLFAGVPADSFCTRAAGNVILKDRIYYDCFIILLGYYLRFLLSVSHLDRKHFDFFI
jgi:hypothetical protein